MPTVNIQGFDQYYELHGQADRPPVLLISGLGGTGASWGCQVERLAREFHVILPDQRGTGRSSRAADGYTTRQLAADMAGLLHHLGLGPVHVVGASTGGAIAQHMALDHPEAVASLVLSSSFARFDAYMHRQFAIRGRMAATWDRPSLLAGYSLFLFSPRYTREQPEAVQTWIDKAASHPASAEDRAIALKRIDMIAAHDTLPDLGRITVPTLVLCGEQNHCTPLPLSEEMAAAIAGARLVVMPEAGELIELEQPADYHRILASFLNSVV
ncbi:alpha/beta fold hydrolase [Novosphingobium terrae]|uniref:alpha/beta fold hydrolase n=1 Tax=Novosphingobium terrae TaxID=2726189 RepID=UPI0019805E03|nr:alpha/beta hydrolase [Novosphingobium terrae]